MRPDYNIKANGQDITALIKKHFISMTVVDEAGVKSDTFELRLSDHQNELELPRKDAELIVSMGYENALSMMGVYIVDEVDLIGPPDIIIIRAKAAKMSGSLKAPKAKSWHETTLGNIVGTIASEHGLEAKVAAELSGIEIAHVDQTDESNLHFLTRLAKQYDAIAKPTAKRLIVAPKGQSKSSSGKALSAINVPRSATSSHRITLADRGKYASVRASWHNLDTGQSETVIAGTGKPAYTLRQKYDNQAGAMAAAKAKLSAFNRGQGVGNINLSIGNAEVMAESPITLSGFRAGVDGKWVASRVVHTLNKSGYTSKLDLETKTST
jgi:phage protein D